MPNRSSKHIPWRLITSLTVCAVAGFISCKKPEKTFPVRKNIEEAVFANGFMQRDNEYTISANATGILQELSVKEGDEVNAGQLIAMVNHNEQLSQVQQSTLVYEDAQRNAAASSDQLQQLQQQISQAVAQLATDKANYERYRELKETNSVSQLDYDRTALQYNTSEKNLQILERKYDDLQRSLQLNASTSKAQLNRQKAVLDNYRLQAVSAGTVISVFKENGEVVRNGDAVARIGSGGFLLKMYVSEDDIVKVKTGQIVMVHLNTYPDTTFTARVTKIYPGFDNNEQSYTVEARFDQLPNRLFSGTQLQANIGIGEKQHILVIPAKFVANGDKVQLENGEIRTIKTGIRNDEWVEVVAGLSPTDAIVMPGK
ncbi:MAG: hypothetical protein DI535_27355 [Citrobacter freundii]|nr:MAG: hypothetical protein DI535_27355 [Citrobacter freundii]